MRHVKHHIARGYTLIELLIALTIGAFLVGGILQLYVGSKKSYSTQQALIELQEVGRFSLNMMVGDIRLAGFMGCGSAANVVNTLNGSAANWEYDAATSILGYEGGASVFPADFSGNVIPGTDAITITRAVPDDRYVVQSHSPATATITLDAAHDFQLGEVLVVTDCLNTAILQQTNANAGNTATTIVNGSGAGAPGNCTQGLGKPLDCSSATGTPYQYDPDSFVLRLLSRAYYIGTGASGRSALFRMTLGQNGSLGAPEEIADGVVDMQLVYGVDTDLDGSIDAYQRADAISAANWGNVLSVQINMLMQSTDDRVADNPQSYILFDGTPGSLAPVMPADRRLRRVYSSTTTIRNRTL